MLTVARARESGVHNRVNAAGIVRLSESRKQSDAIKPFFSAVSSSPISRRWR
jgi:hypothetical protein